MEFGQAALGGVMTTHYDFRHGDTGNMTFADGHAKAIDSKLTCTAVSGAYCETLGGLYSFFWAGP